MSTSDSTEVSPKPSNPPVSTSAATAAVPRTSSRPSFPIAYTQPPSSSVSSSLKKNLIDPSKPILHSTTHSISPSASRAPQAPSSHPPPSNHFVVPAHPQSHHLHSLPPREKTTRTLILDHTAWQHARTRFAQGRCELGMRVRFKRREQVKREPGHESGSGGRDAFYIGAPRGGGTNAFGGPPEVELASSDEDDEEEESLKSDPDGIGAMGYGTRLATESKETEMPASLDETRKNGDKENHNTMDVDQNATSALDGRAATSNAAVAPALAARANGIEKVLNAMLAQPPSPPPRSPSPPPYALHSAHAQSQHYRAPPPTVAQAATTIAKPPRTLPNGVRLRLALLALVNDLFERHPVVSEELPASPTRPQTSGSNATESAKPGVAPSPPNSPTQLPPPSLPPPYILPPALAMLATISSQPFHAPPTLPSFHTLPLPTSSASGSTTLSPISGTGMKTQGTSLLGGDKRSADGAPSRRPPPHLFTLSRPSEGTVSPSSTPSAPLGASSQDMDAERQSATPISPLGPRTSATSRPLATSWQGSALRYPNTGMTRRAVGRPRELYVVGCHAVPNPQTSGSRGSHRSDAVTHGSMHAGSSPTTQEYPLQKLKMLCPRHLIEKCGVCDTGKRGGPTSHIGAGLSCKVICDVGTGSGVLTDMVPRFLRLSALVAMELGREARGEEADGEMAEGDSSAASTSAASNSTARPAQPTRAWYALLCGLLTRAVLEGYVTRGWKGAEYAEVLLGVGLGFNARKDTVATAEEVNTGEFEPDEMPGLVEAGKVLFAGDAAGALDADALEYTAEMESRVSEFLSIPHTTPDLTTHLMGLSAQYPAAPVERAALRFCEAVSQWRGRPELETYKSSVGGRAITPGTLSIQALLASPAPTRPSIERYFRIIPASLLRKRANTDAEEGEERASKREKVDMRPGGRVVQDSDVDAEWVGPYGL